VVTTTGKKGKSADKQLCVNNLGANILISQFYVIRLFVVRVNTCRCRIISERQTSTPVKTHTDMIK
jgi:hypothetical protein